MQHTFFNTPLRLAYSALSYCVFACSVLALTLTAPAALAQTKGKSPAVFSQVAEVEREITTPEGKKVIKRIPAAKVAPGGEVIYTSRIQNTGRKALTGLTINSPIPTHTTLVESSVFGAVTATYSVNGGKQFAPLEKLTVLKDGKTIPATAADVTHLRLQPKQALAAGKTVEAGFRVTVD